MFNWEGFLFGAFVVVPVAMTFIAVFLALITLAEKLYETHTVLVVYSLVIGSILGFTTNAKADDLTLRYSVNAIGAPADVMGLSLGHTFDSGFLQYKLEGGFTSDRRVSNLTGFGLASVGVVPTAGNFFMSFHQGFALLTNPDGLILSGHFQFVEDLGVGFRGNNNTAIVLGARHYSNAGLIQPNVGRDTMYLEIRIPQ